MEKDEKNAQDTKYLSRKRNFSITGSSFVAKKSSFFNVQRRRKSLLKIPFYWKIFITSVVIFSKVEFVLTWVKAVDEGEGGGRETVTSLVAAYFFVPQKKNG